MTALGPVCWVDDCGERAVSVGWSLCPTHARMRAVADAIGLPLKTAAAAARGDDTVAPWVVRALDDQPRRPTRARTFKGGPR